MTRRRETIVPDYFESLYRADPDPWQFATSDYEHAKYAATLAGLGRPRYERALEVGCSIGVFTARLATRCETLLAIDASELALAKARVSCAGCGNVTFEARMVPAAFPDGRFDLLVLSEVLYYLDHADLHRLAQRCGEALTPDGEIVMCHWLGDTDYPQTGAEASDLFATALVDRLPAQSILHDNVYRLQRLSRA